MPRSRAGGSASDGVAELLRSPRFEVMPSEGFDERLAHLPAGATVAVTASRTIGLPATVEKAELAAGRGFEVVPHLAARSVRDRDHLAGIAARLGTAGVTDVFVPGGDRDDPVGAFASAADLLAALRDLDHGFREIGITGYPEGHPSLPGETLARSMDRKLPDATYVTTQLCYDPEAIASWIEGIRARGIELPVYVGIPGAVPPARLRRISRRVGVGGSITALRGTTGVLGVLRRLVGPPGAYTPDDLVAGLAGDPGPRAIEGLHVCTFDRVRETLDWRRRYLGHG